MSSLLSGDPAAPSGPPPSSASFSGEIKTQFLTREGLYKMMALSEYARPVTAAAAAPTASNRITYANPVPVAGGPPGAGGSATVTGGQTGSGSGQQPAPVRVSFSETWRVVDSDQMEQNHEIDENEDEDETEEEVEEEVEEDEKGKKWKKRKRRKRRKRRRIIVFNYGRELFVYPYRGTRKSHDLLKPIDKRIYKGTCPTCHDFGVVNSISSSPQTTSDSNGASRRGSSSSEITPLLVGFTQGQIQLIDPVRKELSKLYNEERLIEKSRVTCIKWIPGSPNLFLASFSSGHLYVFNHELHCPPSAPIYQIFKQGEGYSIYTCKTKSTRNPLYKWSVGQGSITEFSFSPCGHYLALVSQDGYLRVFNYDSMELVGLARSYFGGLTCVCWSPDAKYLVYGGEDDLITVYSVRDKRVVARGQGHRSWITRVAFDEYNLSYGDVPDGLDFSGSDEEGSSVNGICPTTASSGVASVKSKSANCDRVTCYRVGSVGEDTQLCLWDLTEDILTKVVSTPSSSQNANHSSSSCNTPYSITPLVASSAAQPTSLGSITSSSSSKSDAVDNGNTHHSSSSSLTQRFASLNFGDKHKNKNLEKKKEKSKDTNSSSSSTSSSSPSQNANNPNSIPTPGGSRICEFVKLGSSQCPKINEVPLIEPLVTKKIAHERLTSLTFLEDCLVTACQDGYVCTWARPGRQNGEYPMGCPGSPLQHPSQGGGGTIV